MTNDDTALALIRLAHRNMDWDTWGGGRRIRYWDALEETVRASTYRGRTLGGWWEALCRTMGCGTPGNSALRAELADLLTADNQRAILKTLRTRAGVLVLMLRVEQDGKRQAREAAQAEEVEARAPKLPAAALFD